MTFDKLTKTNSQRPSLPLSTPPCGPQTDAQHLGGVASGRSFFQSACSAAVMGLTFLSRLQTASASRAILQAPTAGGAGDLPAATSTQVVHSAVATSGLAATGISVSGVPDYTPLSSNMQQAVQAFSSGSPGFVDGNSAVCNYRVCEGIGYVSEAVGAAQSSLASEFSARPSARPTNWLGVAGRAVFRSTDGTNFALWQGRGVNVNDPNNCATNGVVSLADGVSIANQKIDTAVSAGVNFFRIPLDASSIDGSGNSRITGDSAYMDAIDQIVDHIGTYSGVYVLLSLWMEPTGNHPEALSAWVPTTATIPSWVEMARRNANKSQVMLGLFNEPANAQSDLSSISQIVSQGIAAMRQVEGPNPHVISVSGLYNGDSSKQYARDLSWWEANPLTDANVVYELHPYNTFEQAKGLFSSSLPVLIGEFGVSSPVSEDTDPQTLGDMAAIMGYAEEISPMSYAAWQLGVECAPNLAGQADFSVILTSWIRELQKNGIGGGAGCSPQLFTTGSDGTSVSLESYSLDALGASTSASKNGDIC